MGNARDKTGMIEFVSRTMSETILMFFQKVRIFPEISHQISSFPGDVPIKIKLFFHGFFPIGQKPNRCSPRGTAPDAFACSAGAGRTGPHGRPGHGSGSWAASWVILELL